MKELKNLIIITAIAILAVIVIPTNVLASELITEVRLTMNPIKVGNEISFTATVEALPAGSLETTTATLNWNKSDNSNGSPLEIVTSGTFEPDKYYWWGFDTIPFASGYYTDPTTKFYVNDQEYVYLGWVQPEKIKVTEINFTGPEIVDGTEMPSIVNVELVPKEATTENTISIYWIESDTNLDTITTLLYLNTAEAVTGNFVEGKYYFFNVSNGLMTLNPGYEVGFGVKYTYNGKEIINIASPKNFTYNWLQASKYYSYKFLEGDNQEFTKGKLDSYTFRIDGDYNKFESLKIGNLSLVKDTDYTVTEGSTIITLTTTGINKLKELTSGTYTVETKFTDNTVTGKLIINEENPSTNDNLIINIVTGCISLISLSTCILYIKKRFN